MIVRPECQHAFPSDGKLGGSCDNCGFTLQCSDGFAVWAPELAQHNDGFRAEYFVGLAEGEARHSGFARETS